jgi:phytoene dehydrogenase-like protein
MADAVVIGAGHNGLVVAAHSPMQAGTSRCWRLNQRRAARFAVRSPYPDFNPTCTAHSIRWPSPRRPSVPSISPSTDSDGATRQYHSGTESVGVQIICDSPCTAIEVTSGRASAVRTADGVLWKADRAVIANVSAPNLYQYLLPAHAVPQRVLNDLKKFEWDAPVVKVNYAVREPIPWKSKNLGRVGTVHVGADRPGLTRWITDINTGVLPQHPFMLVGQMTTSDPSRSGAGTESAWA